MEKDRVNFTKVILSVIGVAGILSVAAIAPNAIQALTLFPQFRRRTYAKSYVRGRLDPLISRGLITIVNKNNLKYVRLTEAGKEQLKRYKFGDIRIRKPRRWDGKWRMAIFDIKEARRRTRNLLRQQLSGLGLVMLQQSVWVYPYDFSEVIILLKADFRIGKDLLYLTVDKLENDAWLREQFGL